MGGEIGITNFLRKALRVRIDECFNAYFAVQKPSCKIL
jgi:hypothetical protein